MANRVVGLLRDTFYYSVGLVLRRGMTMITLPLFTRYLTKSEFGVLALVGTARDLLTVAFEFGIPNSSARFFYDCRTEAERRRLFGSLFIFLVVASLLGSLALLTVGATVWARAVPEVPFHPYVSLTIVTALLSTAGILPRSLFRVTDRVRLFMTLGLIQGVATAAIAIALVLAGFGVLGPVLGTLATSTVFFSSSSGT